MVLILPFILTLISSPGWPGPESSADYHITAILDTDSHIVICTEDILFTNGMDFPVDTLWLHLYPNAYRDTSSAFARDLELSCRYDFMRSAPHDRGWIDTSSWTVNSMPCSMVVDGTLGFIPLTQPLAGGDSISLACEFSVKIPTFWSRLGRHRETYQITQWYPKMCALDSSGWHRARYHASGEFFSDFGRYQVSIDVPADFTTAATGRIVHSSFDQDSTRRTDTWQAENVHDFAWSTSPCYTVYDHVYNYPDTGGTVRVHLVQLENGEEYWEGMAELVDSTLAYYGEWYTPYPYNDLWVVDPVLPGSGGMEYPQFVFSSFRVRETRLRELVTAHEVGHQWFYGILANDEVNEAWLDEGMNTFSEIRLMERLYGIHGNVTKTPDWLLAVSDRDLQTLSYSSQEAVNPVPVLSTATGAGDGSYSPGYTYYIKPAFFMSMLQSELGDSLFHQVMATYSDRFIFHHPHTGDFQAIVEELSKRDWSREFDYWLRGTGSADYRMLDLSVSGDSTIAVVGGFFPHSVSLPVAFGRNGDSLCTRVNLNPGSTGRITVPGNWSRAIADPQRMYPDSAPWNNSYPPDIRLKPLLLPISIPSHHSLWLLPFALPGRNGWSINGASLMTPLPAENGGPYTSATHVSRSIAGDEQAMFSSYLSWLGRDTRERTELFYSGFMSGYGYTRVNAGIDVTESGPTRSEPVRVTEANLGLVAISDSEVFDQVELNPGGWLEGEITRGCSHSMPEYTLGRRVSMFAGLSSDAELYLGGEASLEISDVPLGGFLASSRLYAGGAAGSVPPHRAIRAGGDLFTKKTLAGSFLVPGTVLSPDENVLIEGGPALYGYGGSDFHGDAGFSARQLLIHGTVPVGVFAEAGWAGESASIQDSKIIADAGFLLQAGMIRVAFPIWVSAPAEGEDETEFRWRITFMD